MNAYSLDLRRRVVDAVGRGMPRGEVAEMFGVSLSTIKRYLRLECGGSGLAPKPSPGRPPKIAPEQQPDLEAQLREHDTATLSEHAELWRERGGESLSIFAMSRAIKRIGWTRKEGRWVPQGRDERARSGWRMGVAVIDPARLRFIDECGSNIALSPIYARAPGRARRSRSPAGARGRLGARPGTTGRTPP